MVSFFAHLAIGTPVVAAPRLLDATADDTVTMYFGAGCFWHVQHEFVEFEASTAQRSGAAITSISGYAGGLGYAVSSQLRRRRPGPGPAIRASPFAEHKGKVEEAEATRLGVRNQRVLPLLVLALVRAACLADDDRRVAAARAVLCRHGSRPCA